MAVFTSTTGTCFLSVCVSHPNDALGFVQSQFTCHNTWKSPFGKKNRHVYTVLAPNHLKQINVRCKVHDFSFISCRTKTIMYDCMMYEISQLEMGDKKNALYFLLFFLLIGIKSEFSGAGVLRMLQTNHLKGLLHKVGNRRFRLPKNSLLLAVDGSEKKTSGRSENLTDVTSGLIFSYILLVFAEIRLQWLHLLGEICI